MRPSEIEDIETGHRMVATAMIISAVIVAISQHWPLALRQWITDRVSPSTSTAGLSSDARSGQ